MKLQELPFKIGIQYENWEFDLEPIDLNLCTSYDKYKYIKEVQEIFKLQALEVYLYFKLDILVKVQYVFMGNVKNKILYYLIFNKEGEKINKQLKKSKINLNYSTIHNKTTFEYKQ